MVGEFRNKEGKITKIRTKPLKVYLENMQKARKDGTKVNIPFHPSNLQIINLNLDDRIRTKALERASKGEKNAS